MSDPDLNLLLDHLRYWPEVRQFTWAKSPSSRGQSFVNRPAGCRDPYGHLRISFRGRVWRVEQVIAAWEERQLTASSPRPSSHPAA